MHHRIVGDAPDVFVILLFRRQLAFQKQITGLHEVALFGQLFDRVSAIEQLALVPVDIRNGRTAGSRRHESGIIRKLSGRVVQLPDIDTVRADRALVNR